MKKQILLATAALSLSAWANNSDEFTLSIPSIADAKWSIDELQAIHFNDITDEYSIIGNDATTLAVGSITHDNLWLFNQSDSNTGTATTPNQTNSLNIKHLGENTIELSWANNTANIKQYLLIYNLQGTLCYQSSLSNDVHQCTVDTSTQASGVYQVILLIDHQTQTTRYIKK